MRKDASGWRGKGLFKSEGESSLEELGLQKDLLPGSKTWALACIYARQSGLM